MGIGLLIPAAIGAHQVKTNYQLESFDLKREINSLIDKYKPHLDEFNNLVQKLKLLDLHQQYESMEKISGNITTNFKMFLEDQKQKINLISKLKDKDPDMQKYDFPIIDTIVRVMQEVLFWFEILTAATAVEPIEQIVASVGLIIQIFTDVFAIFDILKQIQDLKQRKKNIEQTFSAGGSFQKNQIKLIDISVTIIRNLYILISNGRNTLKSLIIQITVINIDNPDQLNYGDLLSLLKQDPFGYALEQQILNSYIFISDTKKSSSYDSNEKIVKSFTIIDHLTKDLVIFDKLKKFREILSKFQQKTQIGKKLNQQYMSLHILHQIRTQYAIQFQLRKNQQKDKLIKYDQQLLQKLASRRYFSQQQYETLSPQQLQKKKQKHIALVVAFFAKTFFGDDKTGATLYGINIKELSEKISLLEFIDTSGTSNRFILPQPIDEKQREQWIIMKSIFIDEFKKKGGMKDLNPHATIRCSSIQQKFKMKEQKVDENIHTSMELKYVGILKVSEKTFQQQLDFYQLNKKTQSILKEKGLVKLSSGGSKPQFLQTIISPLNFLNTTEIISGSLVPSIQKMNFVTTQQIPKINLLKSNNSSINKIEPTKQIKEQNYLSNGHISINLATLKYQNNQIKFSNAVTDKIPLPKCQNIKSIWIFINFIVNGCDRVSCLENIQIFKAEGKYTGHIECKASNSYQLKGRLINYLIVSSVLQLPKVAQNLRKDKKQLFIISLVHPQCIICWYLS